MMYFLIIQISVMILVSIQDIFITVSIYKGIRNLLESYHVPELSKVQILSRLTEIPFVFNSYVCLI